MCVWKRLHHCCFACAYAALIMIASGPSCTASPHPSPKSQHAPQQDTTTLEKTICQVDDSARERPAQHLKAGRCSNCNCVIKKCPGSRSSPKRPSEPVDLPRTEPTRRADAKHHVDDGGHVRPTKRCHKTKRLHWSFQMCLRNLDASRPKLRENKASSNQTHVTINIRCQ